MENEMMLVKCACSVGPLLPNVERNGSTWVLVLVVGTEFNVTDTQRDLTKAPNLNLFLTLRSQTSLFPWALISITEFLP